MLTEPSGITTFQEYCRRLFSIRVASSEIDDRMPGSGTRSYAVPSPKKTPEYWSRDVLPTHCHARPSTVTWYTPLGLSSLTDTGRVRRVGRKRTSRKQAGAGHIHQQGQAVQRAPQVRHGLRRAGNRETVGLGGQVVPGPDRRIAAAGVVHDLAAVFAVDRVQNRPDRDVARLNYRIDGEGVRFRAV